MATMSKHYPQPVIVGTELTGLLISIALSNAQISHVLLGNPPGDQLPRMGQILTPVGTPTFAENFPELAHLAYPKKQRSVHVGDYYMQLDFSHPTVAPILSTVSALGGPQFTYPWNLDRVATDKALFEKAVHAPFCHHVAGQAQAAEYDQPNDYIRSITLEDGTQIPTSHLFDATGHERFLGRQLNLPCRALGTPQMIVHALYEPAEGSRDTPLAAWYQDRANVGRLYRDQDGIDGIVCCIPLGDHISIHLSHAVENQEFSTEQLLVMAQNGLNRYGIRYQECFPRCTQSGSAIQEQYVHERAFGANWLLTGSAYCNTLVSIAANTDTYFAAYYVGPNFLREPQTVGTIYQQYLDYFLIMQEVWHWGLTHAPEAATKQPIRHSLDRYIWANQSQYFQFLQLRNHDNPLRFGLKFINRITDFEVFSQLPATYATVEKSSL